MIAGMQQASRNLTESLHEVYEPDWHGKDDVMTIGRVARIIVVIVYVLVLAFKIHDHCQIYKEEYFLRIIIYTTAFIEKINIRY